MNCLFKYFVHFLNEASFSYCYGGFFVSDELFVRCVSGKYLLPFCGLLFHSVEGIVLRDNFLILVLSDLSIFYFMVKAFCVLINIFSLAHL